MTWFQIRDVTYNAGLRLTEADSAEEALLRYLESLCRACDGSWPFTGIEPFKLAHANGTALAVMGSGRKFAAVPVKKEEA